MYEKEKRKRKPISPWLRSALFAILFMSLIGALILPLFLFPRILMFLICGLFVAAGMSVIFYIQPASQSGPTLNQIRQNPDNYLIVQQWNGREWVDTLRSAAKDAQDIDSSQR